VVHVLRHRETTLLWFVPNAAREREREREREKREKERETERERERAREILSFPLLPS
jgi:hypothetical protein